MMMVIKILMMMMAGTQLAAPAHQNQRLPGPSSRCAQSWVESHYDEIMKTMTMSMMIIKRWWWWWRDTWTAAARWRPPPRRWSSQPSSTRGLPPDRHHHQKSTKRQMSTKREQTEHCQCQHGQGGCQNNQGLSTRIIKIASMVIAGVKMMIEEDKNTFRYSLVGESLTHLPPAETVDVKNNFENHFKNCSTIKWWQWLSINPSEETGVLLWCKL